jgi:hypothetical protein
MWLVERALEHDKPSLLLQLACDEFHRERIVRPGLTRLERLVATARQQAHEETFRRLGALLTVERHTWLDSLLRPDPETGHTMLQWLRRVLPMRHLSHVALRAWLWNDQLVPETLMMALDMIMRKVRLDYTIQRPLAQYEQLGECLLLKFGCKNFSVCL